jgi:SAM-dependent methyltransferase
VFSYEHLHAIRRAEIDKIASFLPVGARVLEVGAGTGGQASELQHRGFAVTAIELAESSYAAHRLFPIVDYDGRSIPLPDRSVDVVFSSNVLEHVPDLARMHAEIKRVLAPGGMCLHVLPTHTWRIWTTIVSYPDAVAYFAAGLPKLFPQSLPRSAEIRRLGKAWYLTARHVGGRCLPRRHGERGNLISETWLFHPNWWRRNFRENGFTIVHDEPMGVFYTGNMLLGTALGLPQREKLASIFGSACHLFQLVPATTNKLTSVTTRRTPAQSR